MRIAVVGASGSGKTTLGRHLSQTLSLSFIELDAINWQANWRDLVTYDKYKFIRRVDAATTGERWVTDGNYKTTRAIVWTRATHVVWLDYPRPIIMRRVIGRSLARAWDKSELWSGTGNRERWTMWFDKEHPIRWAWSTWRDLRVEYETALADNAYTHLFPSCASAIRARHLM